MPLKDNRVADPEVKRMRCWKCDGILNPKTAIDLHCGVSVELLLCPKFGCRWHGGEWPRPVIAA